MYKVFLLTVYLILKIKQLFRHVRIFILCFMMKIFYAYLFSLGGRNFCSLATSLYLTLPILREATLDGFWLNSLPSRRLYELEAATQCFFKQPPGLVLKKNQDSPILSTVRYESIADWDIHNQCRSRLRTQPIKFKAER